MLNTNKADYKAWLLSLTRDTTVGHACDPDDCPLSRWYASMGYIATVNYSEIEARGETDTFLFHPWAWQTGVMVLADEEIGVITAGMALEMLATLEQWEGGAA